MKCELAPRKPTYDFDRGGLRFWIRDAEREVQCFVSEEGLRDLAAHHKMPEDDLAAIFGRFSKRITALAANKYAERVREPKIYSAELVEQKS